MDTVDRAAEPDGGTTNNICQINVDGVVEEVKLRKKPANGEGRTLDPPLRDSALPQDRGSPSKFRISSTASKRNTRKRMEDRHVVLHDLAAYVSSNLQYKVPRDQHISFYAVYDGHAGVKAAASSAYHLHEKLVDSQHFETNPQQAIVDAIKDVDKLICETPDHRSGSTVALALIKDRTLYAGWLGDSQSVLARNGQAIRLVDPHHPSREDEKSRIEELGGWVNFWGTWRVNGSLAVSRAVGDASLKPYVSTECDVTTVQLGDQDDFLIVACDGLWDGLTFDEAVQIVYERISKEDNLNPSEEQNPIEELSSVLSKAAMEKGSTDNITVIVVFLRDVNLIKKDISNRPPVENLMEGITSTSEFVENPSLSRTPLDPAEHQPPWIEGAGKQKPEPSTPQQSTDEPTSESVATPAQSTSYLQTNTPSSSSQQVISGHTPKLFDESGGRMFSPDPFSSLAQLQSSKDQESFGQTTVDDLRLSPAPNSEDVTDCSSTSIGRESPQKAVDSGFISPEEIMKCMKIGENTSAGGQVDQLLKLLNTEDDSPPPEEEQSLEDILAERRNIPDSADERIDGESEGDDDDDDDDDENDHDAVADENAVPVVEDDSSESSEDFEKVEPAVEMKITGDLNTKEGLEVQFSKLEVRDAEMDPCEQVVVKETHPEESGCLVPPTSTLPTSQEAVLEHLEDPARESSPHPTVEGSVMDTVAPAVCAGPPVNGVKMNGTVAEEDARPDQVEYKKQSVEPAVETAVVFESAQEPQGFMLKTPTEGEQELNSFPESEQPGILVENQEDSDQDSENAPRSPRGLQIPSLNIIPSTPTRSRSLGSSALEESMEGMIVNKEPQSDDEHDEDPAPAPSEEPAPVSGEDPELESQPTQQSNSEENTRSDMETEPRSPAESHPEPDLDSEQGSESQALKSSTSDRDKDSESKRTDEIAVKDATTKSTAAADKKTTKPVPSSRIKPDDKKAGTKPSAAPRAAKTTVTRPTTSSRPATTKPKPDPAKTKTTGPATKATETKAGVTRPAGTSRPPSKPSSAPGKPATGAPRSAPASTRTLPPRTTGPKTTSTNTKPAVSRPTSAVTRTTTTRPSAASSRPAAAATKVTSSSTRPPAARTVGTTARTTATTRTTTTTATRASTMGSRTVPGKTTATGETRAGAGSKPASRTSTLTRPAVTSSKPSLTTTATTSSAGNRRPAATKPASARSGFSNPTAPSAAASRVAAAREAAKKASGTLTRKPSKIDKSSSKTTTPTAEEKEAKPVAETNAAAAAGAGPDSKDTAESPAATETAPPVESVSLETGDGSSQTQSEPTESCA